MDFFGTGTCLVGAVLLFGMIFLAASIRVVPEYQRLVIFRLGRPVEGAKGPGLVFLLPAIDRAIPVDLREQMREVPPQVVRSLDQLPVSCSFRWYYKVIDPVQSVLSVGNHEIAAIGFAVTTLRALIGEINANDIPAKHEYINQSLRARLDETTGEWGVRVTHVDALKIIVDDRQMEIDKAQTVIGISGEAQTAIFTAGTVLLGNQLWDAMSADPIPPKSKVRVKRVVLEVEQDSSS